MSRKTNSGYTLIELVVYMAIFATASILVVIGIIQLSGVFRLAQSERRVSDAATTAMDRILREIRLACDIATMSGTSLNLSTLPSHATGQSCDSARTILKTGNSITINSAAITMANVSVANSDIFTEIKGGISSKAVRVKLVLSSGTGKYQVTRSYYSMAVLRGSY